MRTINDVYYGNAFIKHVDAISPLSGKWAHNVDTPTCDLTLLDNYIKMQIGRSKIHPFVDNEDFYNTLRTVLESNNYRLEKNWESVLAEFNPIENYDRYEDSTINDTINIGQKTATVSAGEHKTVTNIGEREQTNTNGEQDTTTTSESKTTPFDSGDYSKATDKNTTTSNSESYTDTIHTDGATDTTTQNAYTDTSTENAHTDTEIHTTTSHIHGNIGVVDAPTMLEKFRTISNYNFFDVVVNIIEEYITVMNYESEEY